MYVCMYVCTVCTHVCMHMCVCPDSYTVCTYSMYTQNITTEGGYCIIAASLRLNFILMDKYLEGRV